MSLSSISDPVRLGVVGLGRGFALSARAFAESPHLRLVAAADPLPGPRAAFVRAFGGRSYPDVAALAADPEVEAVYVATPHGLHRAHAETAFRAGKHVLVEKPIAVTLADAEAMVAAAAAMGVHLIVGPCHSFDAPVTLAAEVIAEGEIGVVRMVHALNCTDYLRRPRRPEELDTTAGGGVVFGQAVHQVDVVRRLCGGRATSVCAQVGAWDAVRPTEGAYAALLTFASGVFASLVYSGYGHFDSDIWQEGLTELGTPRGPRGPRHWADAAGEAAAQVARGFAGLDGLPGPVAHEHFGPVLVFGDRGDLRLTPRGVELWRDGAHRFLSAPVHRPRLEVAEALHAALRRGHRPVQTGRWGLATLEVCEAILASARSGAPVTLHHQREVGG